MNLESDILDTPEASVTTVVTEEISPLEAVKDLCANLAAYLFMESKPLLWETLHPGESPVVLADRLDALVPDWKEREAKWEIVCNARYADIEYYTLFGVEPPEAVEGAE